MYSSVWSIGIQKHKNDSASLFISDPQISSIRQGLMKRNDRNDINGVDDHRVWLCIRVTSSIGKDYGLSTD